LAALTHRRTVGRRRGTPAGRGVRPAGPGGRQGPTRPAAGSHLAPRPGRGGWARLSLIV